MVLWIDRVLPQYIAWLSVRGVSRALIFRSTRSVACDLLEEIVLCIGEAWCALEYMPHS